MKTAASYTNQEEKARTAPLLGCRAEVDILKGVSIAPLQTQEICEAQCKISDAWRLQG